MTKKNENREGYVDTRIGWLPVDWECKTIGKQFVVSSGGTPSRKEPIYWNGEIPWITTGEIKFNPELPDFLLLKQHKAISLNKLR